MGTIPSYPMATLPLDGTEVLAGWQNGHQVALPGVAVAAIAATKSTALAAAAAATASTAAHDAQSAADFAGQAAQAVRAATGAAPIAGPLIYQAVNRQALAAIGSPVNGAAAFLGERGREGAFVFRTGDLSAMVAIDPQQGIYVPPAIDASGKSGAWVRHRREAVGYSVTWFGAVADCRKDGTTNPDGTARWVGTDNQISIQACWDFVAAIGGATAFFPDGIYGVAGQPKADALQQSFLLLPRITQPSQSISFGLEGATKPDQQARNGGAILQFIGTVPSSPSSFIGGSAGGQHGCTWLTLDIKKLGVRLPPASNMIGIDARAVQALSIAQVRVDIPDAVGDAGGGYAVQNIPDPTGAVSIGIYGPSNDIPQWNLLTEIQIVGFKFGLIPGELHVLSSFAISGCEWPLYVPFQRHAGKIGYGVFTSCKNGAWFDGPVQTMAGAVLSIERTPAGQSGLGWTQPYGLDVRDDGGWLRTGLDTPCDIHIHDLDANGNMIKMALSPRATENAYIRQVSIPQGNNVTFNDIFAGFGGPGGIVDASSLRQKNIRNGKTGWDSVTWDDEPTVAAGKPRNSNQLVRAFSAEVANNGHRDYQIVQVRYVCDGALDRGAFEVALAAGDGGDPVRHWKVGYDGQLQKLQPWLIADSDAAAGAAGARSGAIYKDSNGMVRVKA